LVIGERGSHFFPLHQSPITTTNTFRSECCRGPAAVRSESKIKRRKRIKRRSKSKSRKKKSLLILLLLLLLLLILFLLLILLSLLLFFYNFNLHPPKLQGPNNPKSRVCRLDGREIPSVSQEREIPCDVFFQF